MPKTKTTSPARSLGGITTPKRKTTRSSRSLCSPALSTASGRLTSLIDQFKDKNMESFALSPLNGRSVLNDNTEIEEPRRKSWWKKLDENSQDIMEVLEDNRLTANNAIEEFIDLEVLSQEKKNYTLDLPESSDNESINSIVLPQRRLFTQKENQPQKKYGHLIDNRESLAKLHKTNTANIDKTVNVGTRELFQNAKRSKPIFPAALLNISPNKTTADKTRENVLDPKPQVRNIFGNRPANKRKNMFADFIVSESEDEIPEIQPKVFGFQKKIEQRRISSISKGRDASPASSITTDIEMDFRMLLPSSTMVENQLEDNMLADNTPIKRARLSKLSEAKESEAGTLQTNTTSDKTKQSNKSVASKNKSKASPEIREKSLNSSRTTRSMLKNASKRDENVNTSVKQDAKGNKSQSKISSKDNELDVSPSKSDTDKQSATLNKSRKQNLSKTRNSPKAIETEIESEEIVVNDINNVTRVINKSTNKSLPNTTATNKSLNEKERTVTIKVHDKADKIQSNDVEQNEQEEDENNFTLQYENDIVEEEAEVHNDFNENQKDNTKKHNTVVLENDSQETEINKSKSNKSSLTNKSLQKIHKPAKTVEESVESQNEQYSADDNVDGIQEQETENVQNKGEEIINEEIDEDANNSGEDMSDGKVIEENEQDNEVEGNLSQKNEEEANGSEENEDEVNVSQENEEEMNESQEKAVNESQEVENEVSEGEDEGEANESDEHEGEANVNEDEANESKEVEAEVNECQEVEEETNESQEIEEKANESQEDEEEANESQEIEEEVNKSQEIEEKANESQEDEEDTNESQEIEEEAIKNQEEEEEANESQDIDEEAHESQEVVDAQASDEENDEEMNEDEEDAANDSQVNEASANESQEVENDEEESHEVASEAESEEVEDDQQMDDSDEPDKATASDPEISDDNQADKMEVDDEDEQESDNESEQHEHDSHEERQIEEQNEVEPSGEEIEESPNATHDTTRRHRKKDLNKSPEVILHSNTNQMDSFTAKGRNTSVRKTKSMIKNLNIKPSLEAHRDSTGFSDGTKNSSAEGSGWDSHRTTRKTLRQTFGKDFTPRKSLRALVMEKSAKRQTEHMEMHSETVKFPLANSTEMPEDSNHHVEDFVVSDHEVSRRTRQATLEMYLQKINEQDIEKKHKMEAAIRNSLKTPVTNSLSLFKVPNKPAPRRPKPTQSKAKKQLKSIIPFDELPSEVIEDMKYKPPKRFQPTNASWITKRLYKYLENKLEAKYDYKARVRAEKLVETIYYFAKDLRRHDAAPTDAVNVLKQELARLEVVRTHFEFYEFFHEFMPREVRVKVVPDIVNKIALPRHGVFSDILRGNTVQG